METLLGRGGMGEVWRAADLRLKRTVAVKILSLNGMPGQAVARFRREAEIAGGLQHPGIAVVFDTGTDSDVLYLVMELLDGTDLAEVVRRHSDGLPAVRAVTLLAQIADALAEAHAKGIVHRDIKPANVMLLKDDRIKILDFGIARYTEQTTDLTGSALIGTPAFMAPEQFDRDQGVDHRTDLYALGALAYELLTGRRPFTADTVRQLLHDVLFTPAPAVRDTHAHVPPALNDLIAELLAKDPDDRPGSALIVAARLRAVDHRTAPAPLTAGRKTAVPPAGTAAKPTVRLSASGSRSKRSGRLRWPAATLLVVPVLALGAFCVNPGGPLQDGGDFRAEPACGELRPAVFSNAATEDEGGIDCHWYKEQKKTGVVDDGSHRKYDYKLIWDLRVSMSLHSPKPWEWQSGPDVAATYLQKQAFDGDDIAEPRLGPGAYYSLDSSPYADDGNPDTDYEIDGSHTFAFQINNLVAMVSYVEDRSDLGDMDEKEVRATALKLALEMAAKIRKETVDLGLARTNGA
ncbi:serine/threonine-protein kinase [Spirillospora sp. NPDC049024]